jgi:hypothetical protein
VLAAATEPARTARDVERHDDAVTRRETLDVGADAFEDAHRLVPEDVAGLDRGLPVEEVEVRAADGGPRHADDGIARFLDRGVRHVVHADVTDAAEHDRAHRGSVPVGELGIDRAGEVHELVRGAHV